MDHSSIRTQIPALVSAHVPRNVRSFKFRIYEDLPQESSLGVRMDPQPFEGNVVAKTDQVIVVKIGRAEFAVLDRHQVSQEPDEGTKVQVQPYVRRRFDGLRADTPEERTEVASDGTPYTVKTHILGSAPPKLPAPELRCPELQDLVHQLEQLPAPDGSGASPTSWWMPRPGISPGSTCCPTTSSRRHPRSASRSPRRNSRAASSSPASSTVKTILNCRPRRHSFRCKPLRPSLVEASSPPDHKASIRGPFSEQRPCDRMPVSRSFHKERPLPSVPAGTSAWRQLTCAPRSRSTNPPVSVSAAVAPSPTCCGECCKPMRAFLWIP